MHKKCNAYEFHLPDFQLSLTRHHHVQGIKTTKTLNSYVVMPHKKFGEDFVLEATRNSCFKLSFDLS